LHLPRAIHHFGSVQHLEPHDPAIVAEISDDAGANLVKAIMVAWAGDYVAGAGLNLFLGQHNKSIAFIFAFPVSAELGFHNIKIFLDGFAKREPADRRNDKVLKNRERLKRAVGRDGTPACEMSGRRSL
jgi:hypothetical protein